MVLEEKLLSFPTRARLYFVLGYILRIFPIANIIGSALVPVGWFRIYRWSRSTRYIVAMTGAVLVLVALVYNGFVGQFLIAGGEGLIPPTQITEENFNESKKIIVEALNVSAQNMKNPYTLIYYVLLGIGLLLEAVGIYGLVQEIRKVFQKYLPVLIVILAVLDIASAPIAYIAGVNLEKQISTVENAQTPEELQKALFTVMVSSMGLLTVIGLLAFIVSIIAYVLLAYKFWKIKDYVEEARLLNVSREESRVEEAESREELI